MVFLVAQGNHLSPLSLSFFVVMEAFSKLLDRALEGQYLEGFNVASTTSGQWPTDDLAFSLKMTP